jgi:TonB family protein
VAFWGEVNVSGWRKYVSVLGLCLIALSGTAAGREIHPLFDRYISPAYPSALRGGRMFASVRVNYDIHNDGSVSGIRVTEQTDQKSANSVLSAIKRWRFKPWDVTETMPATIGESVKFVFDQERRERRLRMVISWARRDV